MAKFVPHGLHFASDQIWFDYDFYMRQKLEWCKKNDPSIQTMEQLKEAFENASTVGDSGPQGAFKHFINYGMKEDVSPTPYFDVDYYYRAKLSQLNDKNAEWPKAGFANTVQGLKDYIHSLHCQYAVRSSDSTSDTPYYIGEKLTRNGVTATYTDYRSLNAWAHYSLYGTSEGINPSTLFSTDAYLVAKLSTLGKDYTYDGKKGMTAMLWAFRDKQFNAVVHAGRYGLTPQTGADTNKEIVCWGDEGHTRLLVQYQNTDNKPYGMSKTDLEDDVIDRFTLAALRDESLSLTDESVSVVDESLQINTDNHDDTIVVISDFAYVDAGEGRDFVTTTDSEGSILAHGDSTLVGGNGADFLLGGKIMFAGAGNEYAKDARVTTEANGMNPWVQKMLVDQMGEGAQAMLQNANVIDPAGQNADIYASHAKDVIVLENADSISEELTIHNFELGTDKLLLINDNQTVNGHLASSLDTIVEVLQKGMTLSENATVTVHWDTLAELDQTFTGMEGKTDIHFVYDKGDNALDSCLQVKDGMTLGGQVLVEMLGVESANTSSTLGGDEIVI